MKTALIITEILAGNGDKTALYNEIRRIQEGNKGMTVHVVPLISELFAYSHSLSGENAENIDHLRTEMQALIDANKVLEGKDGTVPKGKEGEFKENVLAIKGLQKKIDVIQKEADKLLENRIARHQDLRRSEANLSEKIKVKIKDLQTSYVRYDEMSQEKKREALEKLEEDYESIMSKLEKRINKVSKTMERSILRMSKELQALEPPQDDASRELLKSKLKDAKLIINALLSQKKEMKQDFISKKDEIIKGVSSSEDFISSFKSYEDMDREQQCKVNLDIQANPEIAKLNKELSKCRDSIGEILTISKSVCADYMEYQVRKLGSEGNEIKYAAAQITGQKSPFVEVWRNYGFEDALKALFRMNKSDELPVINEVIVVPSAHRLISVGEQGINIVKLKELLEQLGRHIQPKKITLHTELCRLQNSKLLHAEAKSEISKDEEPTEKGLFRYNNPDNSGKLDEYLYVYKSKRSRELKFVKFTLNTSYLILHEQADNSFVAECSLPAKSQAELERLKALIEKNNKISAGNKKIDRDVFKVLTYIPVDSKTDPLSFTREHVSNAIISDDLREKLSAQGYKTINCTMIVDKDIPPHIEEEAKYGIKVNIRYVKKLEHTEFLTAIQTSDLYIPSGDNSYLDSLLTKFEGITLYCARFHKQELAEAANFILSKILDPAHHSYMKGYSQEDQARKIRNEEENDIQTRLINAMDFAAKYKDHRYYEKVVTGADGYNKATAALREAVENAVLPKPEVVMAETIEHTTEVKMFDGAPALDAAQTETGMFAQEKKRLTPSDINGLDVGLKKHSDKDNNTL